ncbi:histidine kinase [Microbacterium sp.]|uniref:histidine kinase n=1 Tax=Microbacterium sp. TaxID=51671 RepID=UPI003A8728FD
MNLSRSEVWAALLVGAEGIGVLALAAWQLVALVSGDVESISSAIALEVLTLVGGIAVIAFGVGIGRGVSWARSGGIVTQLLILAVALGALTGSYAHPAVAAGLAAPAVLVLGLLVAGSRAAARRRDETH